jgi:hypothetical protein
MGDFVAVWGTQLRNGLTVGAAVTLRPDEGSRLRVLPARKDGCCLGYQGESISARDVEAELASVSRGMSAPGAAALVLTEAWAGTDKAKSPPSHPTLKTPSLCRRAPLSAPERRPEPIRQKRPVPLESESKAEHRRVSPTTPPHAGQSGSPHPRSRPAQVARRIRQ